ncbi:P-loop containing nucleoside triphosphate hydrolase protein [Xylaria scruposa]|nr:P-loop containing nucleoside triphosphate hydrolase protein [Xylaria scruposa]
MDQSDEKPKVLVVHKVVCQRSGTNHSDHRRERWFFDAPRLYSGDTKKSILRGKTPADELRSYLHHLFRPHRKRKSGNKKYYYEGDDDDDDDDDDDNHSDNDEARDFVGEFVVAVVERLYDCVQYHQSVEEQFELIEPQTAIQRIPRTIRPHLFVLKADGPEASNAHERMHISNSNLLDFLQEVVASDAYTFVKPMFPKKFSAPYLPVYYFLDVIQQRMEYLDNENLQAQLAAFMQYVLDANRIDYAEADDLLSRGRINQKHFWKLFGPYQIVVSQERDNAQAFITGTLIENPGVAYYVDSWSWSFNGNFKRTVTTLEISWPKEDGDEIDITDLNIYPLKFATPEMKYRLKKRGERVWACRHQAYVSYHAPNPSFDVQMAQPRFMIDMTMYNQLHVDPMTVQEDSDKNDTLDSESMARDHPPSEEFILLLPGFLTGYGFHDKKWCTLKVEYIGDIDWQLEAFDRLVLDHNKKEIIQALVSVHVSTAVLKEPHDIIQGKGNALIMLLHGSPGTGKTLTAESIAELTRKPLYRVTCGDVGVEPEAVEKYLNSVLYIGTAWGCVVLLDEADIFLEERTQADLQRNALVSVFLRVLEYYNGILILTTNRVGIFDEAFKSRIQLAIHYPPLDRESRLEIWLNFFNAMRAEDNIDISGLKRKADRLAHYRINGRQIRNTVKSAKQLAYYKREQLNYSHFDRIIRIANEFDRYIEKTHGGNTDEEWARDSHTRAEECGSPEN